MYLSINLLFQSNRIFSRFFRSFFFLKFWLRTFVILLRNFYRMKSKKPKKNSKYYALVGMDSWQFNFFSSFSQFNMHRYLKSQFPILSSFFFNTDQIRKNFIFFSLSRSQLLFFLQRFGVWLCPVKPTKKNWMKFFFVS